jgi:glutamate-1-semialdehyde 2,1-aminomutase
MLRCGISPLFGTRFVCPIPGSRFRSIGAPNPHRLASVPAAFIDRTRSRAAFDEIARYVAGGESSYARLRAGQELVIDRASGATIRDLDGNTYIDYCMGYGVNLFGHAAAFVWEAVEETVGRLGWHIAFPHRLAGEVAELIAEMVPGIEQVRFANSGTEATQAAVRLARAATGRELVIKFEGHYHGWADHLAAGSGGGSVSRPARPDSAGIPAGVMESLWTVPWNDPAALAEAIEAAGDRLAAVICEVVPGSGGVLEPRPGFLEELVSGVRAAGALVIFDEVMTGFRLAAGGAQERYGITPDITTLGKVLGGGMAVAAFGGSRELMRWEAENRVVHGGTYTGSPLGLAASAAVLRRIAAEPGLFDELEMHSALLADGIEDAFANAGIEGHVRRVGSLLQPFFAARPRDEPRDVNEAAALQPSSRYLAFCDGLETRGVYAHRYPLGRWFVSLAHGPEEIEATLAAARGAATDLVP